MGIRILGFLAGISSNSLSIRVRCVLSVLGAVAVILAISFSVRQSTSLISKSYDDLTTKELAYLNSWRKSAEDSKPIFDVEYAAIVAARASTIKNLPTDVKSPDTLLGVVTLPEHFHPIDDMLSLLSNKKTKKIKGDTIHSQLCVAFLEATASDFNRALNNMHTMRGFCDWAVIVHNSDDDHMDPNARSIIESLNNTASSRVNGGSSNKELLSTFKESVKAAHINMELLQETEEQRVLLKRYSSRSNPKGTDGQFFADGGSSTDALARDALQRMNPALFKHYIKFASPTLLADRTGLESEIEPNVASSKASKPSVWDLEMEEQALIRPDRGDIPMYNIHAYPKAFQYPYLLPLLSRYKKVWLLDGDVSLEGFRPERFFRIMECAFAEPPVIAQPLMSVGSPKDASAGRLTTISHPYKYLQETYWKAERENGLADAVTTRFVELGGAVVLDSAFFEWFITRMVIPLLAPAHYLGVDGGIDALLCTAAGMYRTLTKVHPQVKAPHTDRSRSEMQSTRRLVDVDSLSPACIIAVGADVVHFEHSNAAANDKLSKSTEPTTSRKFRDRLQKIMATIVQAVLPNMYASGHAKESDPKMNAHAVARLDAQLSKNMLCKQ